MRAPGKLAHSPPALELDGAVPCAHQRAQQMREFFAQLHDIVALCLEELEQRSQMRRRERRTAAMKRLITVHKFVHPATEIVRRRSVEKRLMMQIVTHSRFLRRRWLDAAFARGFSQERVVLRHANSKGVCRKPAIYARAEGKTEARQKVSSRAARFCAGSRCAVRRNACAFRPRSVPGR
jgi:hypothetical protein